jgi:hypothetical protein
MQNAESARTQSRRPPQVANAFAETYAQLDAVQPAGHMGEISDLVAGGARLNASSRAYFALNWRRFIVNYTAAIL